MTDPLHRRFGLWAAAILLVCLLLEGVAFQYDALATRALTPQTLELAAAAVAREEVPQAVSDVEAVMPSTAGRAPVWRTTVTFDGLDMPAVRTASVRLTGQNHLLRLTFSLSDDSHALGLTTADSVLALPGQTARARLDTHGQLHALQISFETDDASAALSEVILNAPVPYRFSLLRLAALALPLLLLAAVLCFGWARVTLDRRNPRHHLAYGLSALFCVLLIVGVQCLVTPENRDEFSYAWDLRYPFEDEVHEYRAQAHAVLYDMLAHGRVAVDVTPDERLLALDNPYDPTQRLASGAEVMFDYALHNGQYYVYFGLTPVLAEVRGADAVIFGSPIYHMNLTSGLQAFLERFLFPTNIYSTEIPSVLGKKMPSAFFYTMNVTGKQAEKVHLQDSLQPYEDFTSKALGLVPHRLCAYNTLQFDDYTKYESAKFSEADKRAYQEKYGPICLKQAFDLGAALVKEAEALTQTC